MATLGKGRDMAAEGGSWVNCMEGEGWAPEGFLPFLLAIVGMGNVKQVKVETNTHNVDEHLLNVTYLA